MKPINVLSLFDGIACGRLALQRANIKVDTYYASEIEKSSISVALNNFPDIIEVGDVRNLNPKDFSDIDLICFGSPCTNFSMAGKRQGMVTKDKIIIDTLDKYLYYKELNYSFEGQSYLFWEACRLIKEIKPKYFLMENVNMAENWKSIISKELGVQPIEINSNLVSAQNRTRLYWTNIPNVSQPKDKNIQLKDILETNKDWNKATIVGRRLNENGHREDYNKNIPITQCLEVRNSNTNKSNCLTTVEKDNVLTPLSIGRHRDVFKLKLPFRYYSRTEYERLQTLPDGYTKCISESAAKKAIGNAWTVDVIAHILSFIKRKN